MDNNVKLDPYAALKNPEFILFILGRLFTILGLEILRVSLGWQVYKITGDPLSLGMIGLSEFLPFPFIALVSGHIADIVSRKKIIVLCLLAFTLCALCFFYINLDIAPEVIKDNVIPIYGLIFLTGIARGFMGPALFAFMSQIVEEKTLSNAISWNTSVWHAAVVAGPAIGGFLVAFTSFKYVYLVVTLLLFFSLILALKIASRPVPPNNESTGMKERLTAGFKFVFSNQVILTAISLDLFAVLFGGAVALLPMFAKDILMVGPQGLGILLAAPGIGAVLMMFALAHYPITKNAGKKMLLAVSAFGVCIIIFGISKFFWLSVAALLLSGAFDSISVIVRNNLIHKLTPEHMKGRVSAVNYLFVGSSNELGSFESGTLAKLTSAVTAVVIGGIITLGVTGFTAIKAKKLQNLDL